jgi:regulation of enolase protein 1 (concanavalin A-like superfamily)
MLLVANAWGAGFTDDFNRGNGVVGNGWSTQTDGTVKVQIVDNEVLIAGTEATAWARCGISRPVSGETRVSFDFKADDVFNVHVIVYDAASSAYVELYAWAGGPFSYASSLGGEWPGWVEISGSNMVAGEYNTLMLEQKGKDFIVTLNGAVVGTVNNASFTRIGRVLIANDADAGQTGSLHIDNVLIGKVIAGAAKDPSPIPDATDVPRDVVLGWTAGKYANTHNVYLGTDAADVNSADITKAASKGQTGTTFKPASSLEYGKTYYWRVDEVNAPPDTGVYKGNVWSFTTEPYAYTIPTVTATASSSSTTQGMTPIKTVDGSGLDPVTGLHSTLDTAMWLSAPGLPLPAWIRYQFDKPYILQSMKVWNSNQKIEPWVGFGAKKVTVEYSMDGADWTSLGDVQFAQADGTDAYAANTTVDMAGVEARYVRLTIQSNWGGIMQQTGLSEVRFFYVPLKARAPIPAAYAEGVAVDATLDWRDGRKAASHQVYFGTDKQAVVDGTVLAGTTTESNFQPAPLDLGQTYFWKVDEVNEAASWPGDLWSFTTTEYADIDNFESYTNDSPNRVFQAWIDGYGFSPDEFFPQGSQGNGSGAMVGYDPSAGDIMETGSIHGGRQAMPVEYNNVDTPYYSEIERSWATPQNWTANGATTLSLWFQGNPAAFVETASGITLSGAGRDIYQGTAEFRFAYKKLSGDGSITVRVDNVKTLADWTKAGVMIRESLETLSAQVHMISAARQSLVEWMYRNMTNSSTTTGFNTAANTNPLPVWLRITRTGNTFTGEYSANGTTWTKLTNTDGTVSSVTITMPTSVYVGMVVCSLVADNLAVADFSQIKTGGNITGQWQTADIGVAQPANTPEQLYVALQDSAGKIKVINHPDAKATLAGDWTQWTIPLTDFTGVNAKAIKKMLIGFGSRSSPKAGGAGKVLIDDIQYGEPIVPVGLVAHYELESNTLDSSGNGHDGVLAGNAAFPVAYVDGPTGLGKAMLFEGTSGHQYVDLGTFDPSARTGKLTVSLWAKWDGLSAAWQGLIGKRVGAWDRTSMMWQIEIGQTSGALVFQREGNDIQMASTVPVGQWTHVAVTFDGTTAKCYVNGVRTAQNTFSFGSGHEAPIQFGADTQGGGNAFNGALDEIRMYDIVLSDAEIAALAGK